MPHQDHMKKLKRERNILPALRDYEASSDDRRPIADPELELAADKSGKIHGRLHPGESEMLPGYGTTDMGISPFKPKFTFTTQKAIVATGIATAGVVLWKFKDHLTTGLNAAVTYALLLRESYRA